MRNRPEKQNILEIGDLKERATEVLKQLTKEFQMLELKNQIQSKVKVDIDKQQREDSSADENHSGRIGWQSDGAGDC